MHDACLLQTIMQKQTQRLGVARVPRTAATRVPHHSVGTELGDEPELPLPRHTHKRKCSWKTGFLLSGTVFVFCLHFQSASGTIDIFMQGNKQHISHLKASTRLAALLLRWQETAQPLLRVAKPQRSN